MAPFEHRVELGSANAIQAKGSIAGRDRLIESVLAGEIDNCPADGRYRDAVDQFETVGRKGRTVNVQSGQRATTCGRNGDAGSIRG